MTPNFNLLAKVKKGITKNKKNEIKSITIKSIDSPIDLIMDSDVNDDKTNDMNIDFMEATIDNDDVKILQKELLQLKELNMSTFKELNPDTELFNETTKQLQEIERELKDINELMVSFSGLLVKQGEELNNTEDHVVNTNQTIAATLPILEETIEEIKEINNKYITLKIVGGAVLGGILFGGVGSIFGIIPGIVCTGVGTTSGVAVGYLSKYINNYPLISIR